MRQKRKGSEADASTQLPELSRSPHDLQSSNLRSHYSLDDYTRLKKRRKEDAGTEPVASCKSKLASITTAPPCGSSSLVAPGRGLKRKIGCIDVATGMGRKKKIEDDYISGDTIGQGKFGSVRLCRSKISGEEFACKTLKKGVDLVHQEVEIMQHLSGHPGVVTLKAVYEEPESFHLVMELCSGGRLIDQMKEGRFSEQRVANIFKEVMLVIKYCHEIGVIHRDIKPENILLTTSGKLKLADFGLAMRFSSGQSLTGLAGSPAYVAPEVLIGNYSEKVDIWSAGVLLHALLVGALPFKGDSKAVFEAIKSVKLDFQSGKWQSVSKLARDLIARMLTRDVSARITAEEVLRHPWILVFTECTLKSLSFKSKLKNQVAASSVQVSAAPGLEQCGSRVCSGSANRDSTLPSPPSLSCKPEETDECVFVDALSVAISQVRISEPKRSRL
ncbi:hypothetical protein EUGRSUZ_J01092 [Eucalyptus grandis]|uniref:Protein kinase domain-containing protein n=3 Tax=Eucalyptus grandis TaxID=71139 RepID=A0A059ACX8_EUCGR|nr:hypothetical protein EUGRSUZ_J01092 [Eucalyptus grandis]KAK3408967.1 hypothetical protein EUGRSUZ_J01092 [Eucalyptus grandis]